MDRVDLSCALSYTGAIKQRERNHPMKTNTNQRDRLYGLATGLTHEEANDLLDAVRLAAAALDTMDVTYPDPEMRAQAGRMRALGERLRQMNAARDELSIP